MRERVILLKGISRRLGTMIFKQGKNKFANDSLCSTIFFLLHFYFNAYKIKTQIIIRAIFSFCHNVFSSIQIIIPSFTDTIVLPICFKSHLLQIYCMCEIIQSEIWYIMQFFQNLTSNTLNNIIKEIVEIACYNQFLLFHNLFKGCLLQITSSVSGKGLKNSLYYMTMLVSDLIYSLRISLHVMCVI